MVAGLAGLTIGFAGLSAAGLAAAAPAVTIENPDVIPYPDRIVMNKVQNGTDDVTENDVGDVKIINSGDQPLSIQGLTIDGPFQLITPPTLPAIIQPGASLMVSMLFTAKGEGPNGGPHNGSLTITSNAANAPTRVVELSGFWQINSGGSNEGTLEEMVPTFGYKTVIVGPGQKLQKKGHIETAGDEVLAKFWQRMDPSLPVTVRQLGAFHNPSADSFAWYPKGASNQVKVVLRQLKEDYQTLLPRRDPDGGPGVVSFTPTSTVFGFKLASKWSDDMMNPKTESCVLTYGESQCGHAVRFWPIKDRNGVPVAGQYLATMDFAEVSSGNYDYQDNWYLMSNVIPEGATVDAVAPTLTAKAPADGSSAVDPNANITATFSEAMFPASLNAASFSISPTAGGTPVPATVSLAGAVATLDPTAPLAPGTQYTVTVTTGAADMAGNPLAAEQSWTFTTAGVQNPVDTVKPTVASRAPANGATNIAVGANVTVNFSEPMNAGSVNGSTFTVAPAGGAALAGTVTANAGGTGFTFNPAAALAPSTSYTVTVTTGASDLAGNTLAANDTWTFKTAAAGDPGVKPGPGDDDGNKGIQGGDDTKKPTRQAKAFCARYPKASAVLARQMKAAKRAKAKAKTARAKAAANKRIAAILKKQRRAKADYRKFTCKAIEHAAFCKAYPRTSKALAKKLATARKLRTKAATPAAKRAAAKKVAKLMKQHRAAVARHKTCD
jgi:hypothetical protein